VAYDIAVGIHSGTISAQSRPGIGTTVTVTIPKRPVAADVIDTPGPAFDDA
jgi:signal transduction histidine kinase